jgi:hypothetical protein
MCRVNYWVVQNNSHLNLNISVIHFLYKKASSCSFSFVLKKHKERETYIVFIIEAKFTHIYTKSKPKMAGMLRLDNHKASNIAESVSSFHDFDLIFFSHDSFVD